MVPEPAVLLPAKSFSRAKSRLGAVLSDAQRQRLAEALFERALEAVRACVEGAQIAVATDSAEVAQRVRAYGARVILDGEQPARLGEVVDRALDQLYLGGARRCLVLMTDLPLLEPPDVRALLLDLRNADCVVAPDSEDQGTNALGIPLAANNRWCFGHPDSFPRHLRAAAQRGFELRVVRRPALAFDLDTPEQLQRLPHWAQLANPRS